MLVGQVCHVLPSLPPPRAAPANICVVLLSSLFPSHPLLTSFKLGGRVSEGKGSKQRQRCCIRCLHSSLRSLTLLHQVSELNDQFAEFKAALSFELHQRLERMRNLLPSFRSGGLSSVDVSM